MKCTKCGYDLPADSEFCQYCGAKTEKLAVAPTICAAEEPKKTDAPTYSHTMPVAQTYPASKKEKPIKKKYCSRCGSLIDSETKVCTGCGKRYFKGIRFSKVSAVIMLVALVLVASIILNVVQFIDRNEIIEQKDYWERRADALQERLMDATSELWSSQQLSNFVNNYVVFIENDGTNLYHKFACSKFKGSSFWVYNINQAQQKGYSECSQCH